MSNPIPSHLVAEFRGRMESADDDDAPDGAWFQRLEDAARDFMREHKLRGCANDAAHQYVRMCTSTKE